jgi:hypothetical protein
LLRKDRSKSHSKIKIKPTDLIARKRSAQAEGGGVKERSSRTPTYPPCANLDGAQRLEGRWI